jgi:S-formylglutathione hydrolase FrmB
MAISYQFDGASKTITIQADPTDYQGDTLRVAAQDIYSRWKDWCLTADGLQFDAAFEVTGRFPISDTVQTGAYYFLRTDSGWHLHPPNKDGAVLVLEGNIYPYTVGDRIVQPLPGVTTTTLMQTSSLTEVVVTSDGLNSAQAALLQTAATESTKARKMQTNKAIISGDGQTVSIYDDDGATLLHVFGVSGDKLSRTPQ